MRRHRTPPVPLLLALVALPAGLLAGCGGGSIGGKTTGATTTATTASTTATTSTTTTTAKRSATTATTPTTPAQAATAAMNAETTTRPKHRFAAAPITHKAVSQLERRGSIVIPVAVGGPGKVTAFGQAEIPGKGIVHVAEAAPKTVARAGLVKLTFTLLPVARAQLAAGRSILMYVAVGFSKGEVFQRIPVRLRP